jgi:hypothetical protein
MVKDPGKYTTTGGWGFSQFDDVKPASEAVLFPATRWSSARDVVFNRQHLSPEKQQCHKCCMTRRSPHFW